jgi:hypothetical protein
MNNVASRVLHDALANSLGRILDISREQLRVSLWSGAPPFWGPCWALPGPCRWVPACRRTAVVQPASHNPLLPYPSSICRRPLTFCAAWRTGLTLEDVGIRRDAFEQLQLPVALVSGRVGRVAAQVPWATLRTLRSPVVVELADVRLRFALRRDEEMEEGPGGERAWAAKQAELAAAELAELAAAAGGGDAAAAAAAAGRQGGVLDSLLRHVLSVLLNRLQLTVRRLHIEFEVCGGVGEGGEEGRGRGERRAGGASSRCPASRRTAWLQSQAAGTRGPPHVHPLRRVRLPPRQPQGPWSLSAVLC